MMLIVKTPFVGLGYNMPAPGTLLDVTEEKARELLGMGVAQRYEMKVDPVPAEVKKNAPSESLPADLAPPPKTRRNSRKSATKSSE